MEVHLAGGRPHITDVHPTEDTASVLWAGPQAPSAESTAHHPKRSTWALAAPCGGVCVSYLDTHVGVC